MPKVRISEFANSAGRTQELGPGRYSGDALTVTDNSVSSVTVPDGWKVTLWSDAGFSGASRVLTANSPTLPGFDDTLSSLTVTAPRDPTIEESTGSLGFLAAAASPTWVNVGALDIDFSSTTRGFTFEAWVWFDSTGSFARIFDFHKEGQNGVDNILLTRDGSSSDLRFEVRKAGAQSLLIARGVIENGQWLHIAATIDPTGYGRIYCKGRQVAFGQLSMPTQIPRDAAWLGRSGYSQDAYFAGQLAEVRVWGLCRSEVELARAMTSRLTGAEPGLLRYYRMDEGAQSGGTLRDLAGRSNGTVNGTALYALSGPKLAPAADAAGGLWFDGVGDYATLPPFAANFSAGLTIEAWVYFADSGSYARVVELCRSWSVDSIIVAREGTSANLGLWISSSATTTVLLARGVIQNGVWMHVAVTLGNVVNGSGAATIYIDGQVRATGTLIAPPITTRGIAYIGKSSAAWDALFRGRMSEVRLWNRARTLEEIQATRHQRLDPMEPGLVAYYPLDERDSTLAHDVSPSGLHGTLQTGIGWGRSLPVDYVPQSPPATALLFNGSDTYLQLPTITADFRSGLTLEAWVCFDNVAPWGRIFELASGPNADNLVLARYGSSNDIAFVSNQGAIYSAVYAPGVIAVGRWMHVAATLGPAGSDGRALATIYINGTVRVSGFVYAAKYLPRTQSCAGKSTYADPLFKGRMAELRIFTRARTGDEIRATLNKPLLGNEAGLYLYYPLSETSGRSANPQLVPPTSGAPPWPLASTRVFNGSDTVVRLPSPSAEVPEPALTADFTAGFTIEAWVFYDEATNWARIVELGNGPGSDNIVLYRSATSNSLVLSVFRGATAESVVADNALAVGGWLHIAATLGPAASDGRGQVTLYQNGVVLGTGRTILPRNIARTQCYIGKSTWVGDALFKGRMAEVRIWTCARSQAEIQSAMNKTLVGNEPGLCIYRALSSQPTATIQGTAQRQLADLPTTTAGALGFDGVDDAVQLPALDVDLSRGFSLECWVYLDDLSGDRACIVDLGSGSGARVSLEREGSAGNLRLGISNVRGGEFALSAPGVLKPGQWLHIAATQAAGNPAASQAVLYVNGALCVTTFLPPPVYVVRDSAWVGKASEGVPNRLRGRVADLRIYSTQHMQAEIQSAMQKPCAPNELGLAYHFPLDEAAGVVARDAAQQNGALVGPADFLALPHKQSLAFDGTNTYVPLSNIPADFCAPCTVEAWVLFNDYNGSTSVIDLGAGLDVDNLFLGSEGSTSNLRLYTFNGSTRGHIEAVGVIKPNVWMHVAATMDGPAANGCGTASLYIDGELKARGSVPWLRAVSRPASYLGHSSFARWYRRLPGRMSEVRIWNRSLSQAEIRGMMGQPQRAIVPGLVRLFPLTDVGTTIRDLKDGGTVSLIGRPATDSLPLVPDTRSLRFDGNNSLVELQGQSADLSAGLTLEVWFCPSGTPRGNEVLVAFGGGSRGTSIQLWRNHSSGQFNVAVGRAPSLPSLYFTLPRTAEAWVHLAVTIQANQQVVIYVNGANPRTGVLDIVDTDPVPISSELRSRLGLGLDNNFPFQGRMTEVRLWNRVRSAAEIAAAYAGRASGAEAGLLRYYPLTEGWGLAVRDGRSHAAAAVQGDPLRFPRRLPGVAPQPRGLEFNGTSTYVALPMLRSDFSIGITVEAWVYFDGVQAGACVVELGRGELSYGELADSLSIARSGTTNMLSLQVVRGAQTLTLTTANVIVDRTWMHVAVTIEAGVPRIYINGALHMVAPQGPTSPDYSLTAGVGRGKCFLGKSSRDVPLFKGRLADVRLWRRARSAAEIAGSLLGSLALDDPGLVANYRLDEADGLQARDASNARLDADVRGNRSLWGAPSPYLLPDPNLDGCLQFNGQSAWVEATGINANLAYGFTIEAWINVEEPLAVPRLSSDPVGLVRILELSTASGQGSLTVSLDAAKRQLFIVTKNDLFARAIDCVGCISLRTWTHLAVTFGSVVMGSDGKPASGTATIYIDCQSVASATVDAPTTLPLSVAYLGKRVVRQHPQFKGRMAEVRIWSVYRSVEEIRRDRRRRLLGSEYGLCAYYRLNERQGERAGDASRNQRHGWLRDSADWSQTAPLSGISKDGDPGILRMVGQLWVSLPAIAPPATQTVPVGWCLEAWVVCNDISRSGHFIALSNGSSDALYLGHSGSALVFGIQVGSYATQVVTVANVFSNGPWVHVSASIDANGQLWLCRDGVVLQADKNSVTPPSFGPRSQAELARTPLGELFMGYLSEVRIWTTARPPRQVSTAYRLRLGGSVAGLAVCYPLQASRGFAAIDTCAQHRDGIVHGSSTPVWDGNSPPVVSAAPGIAVACPPGALRFDGISTYARLPPIPHDLSTGFTIEAIFPPTASRPVGAVLELGAATGDYIRLIAREDGCLALRIYVGATTYTEIVTGDVLPLGNTGQTFYFCFTVDGSRSVRFWTLACEGSLFIDGVVGTVLPEGRMPRPGILRSVGYLGKSTVPTQPLLSGCLKEVRLWNRACTAAEIGANCSRQLTGAELGLIALYHLNDTAGRSARSAVPGLGDATLLGDVVWGAKEVLSADHVAPPPPLTVPKTAIAAGTALPIVGADASVSGTATTWEPAIITDDGGVNDALSAYVREGLSFFLLGVSAKLSFSGAVTVKPLSQVISLTCQPSLQISGGRSGGYAFPSTTLAMRRNTSPQVYTLCVEPGAGLDVPALVADAVQDPLLKATYSTILAPFLGLLTGCVMLVASDDGSDATYGSYVKGVNLYVTRAMSELPVLSLVHGALPQLGLNTRSVILSIGLRATAGYRVSAGALLNIKILNTTPVSLEFNELGIELSSAQTATAIGVVHRFTLTLLGETLVFRGGVSIEQKAGASAATIWGALDPDQARGTTWKDPWGLKGLEIGGFGVQVRGGSAIGIGCRGEIHIGGGLLGGSVGLNIDTANPILFIDSPEGLDLPRLISAFLSGMPQAVKDALSVLNTVLAIRLKDLKLYFAPNGGEIAGQTFERGISLGATLDLWGYRANIFGRLDESSGAILKGQADRIKIDIGGVTLLQFSDVSGQSGPNVDVALTASRQGIFYSGQLRLLGGVYQGYQELAVGSEGIQFKGGSPLGALALTLNWQSGLFALTVAPRFVYSFDALGIPVNVDIGGEVAQRVDKAGFQQTLKFWFDVCGVGFTVGPVSWSVPLIDIKAIFGVFETFFGDMVKSLFADTIAGGLKQAYEWVRDNLTDLAEEAVEIFKTAGAAVADIAKNVYATFDTTAQEVISFVGGTINQAADLLRNVLGLVAAEAAQILGAAYGVGADAVRAALSVAGYVAGEISSIAGEIWDGINQVVGYLDPTSW